MRDGEALRVGMLRDHATLKRIPRFWESQHSHAQPWDSAPLREGLAGCEMGKVLASTESKKD